MTVDQKAYIIRIRQSTFKGIIQTILAQGSSKESFHQYLYVPEKVAIGYVIKEDSSYRISNEESIYFTDNALQLKRFHNRINDNTFEALSGHFISDEEIDEIIEFGRTYSRAKEALCNITKKITIESNTSYFKK